ncbi:MAG: hypothetical protein ABII72_04440 [Parcubacteria group bacterium]
MDQETRQEFAKLATMVKKGFDGVDKRFEDVDKRFEKVVTKEDSKKFATKDDLKRFATKKDLKKSELDMKDFIEDKLADLKGDLVTLMTKEDNKIRQLIATS